MSASESISIEALGSGQEKRASTLKGQRWSIEEKTLQRVGRTPESSDKRLRKLQLSFVTNMTIGVTSCLMHERTEMPMIKY